MKKEEQIVKEVLGEYASQELRALGKEQEEDGAEPGARMDDRMSRTFRYYNEGKKKRLVICGACAASVAAAALLIGIGIGNIRTVREQDQRSGADAARAESAGRDTENMQYEVYMNHYGEGATLSYASAQNQNRTADGLPEEIAALETMEWSGASMHTDAQTAVRNSNYKNFGYLCADGRGTVYYSDLMQRAVYMSGEDGSGCVKLSDGAGNYLQEKDGVLYYNALDEGGAVVCLNVSTGEKRVLTDEPHGEFVLTERGVLVNAESGVKLLSYDGSSAQTLDAMSGRGWEPALFTVSGETILFNAVQGTDVNYYLQGHLLCYDGSKEEVFYVGQVMMRPLLAGDYLLALKGESAKQASLHVMDMAAGTDTDLGVWPYDGFVSDGDTVYYTRGGMLCRFRGGENREIMNLHEQESELMGEAPDRYLYLAGDYLYWMSQRQVVEDGEVVEVFYEWHNVKIEE
ncbi:MAG: DUF5050 domain-containing protein [bacterium]|nr:DUF5050 domain-containing protein [bacterium]